MAICVALVPNILNIAVSQCETSPETGEKFVLIGLVSLGAAILSPLFFGKKGPSKKANGESRNISLKLSIYGLIASLYFVAVVGIGKKTGLGPGIAETIDSSMAPTIYVFIYFFYIRFVEKKKETPSLYIVFGSTMVFIGLSMIGFSMYDDKGSISTQMHANDALLILFAFFGALGTTLSIWTLRKMVRYYGSSLGFSVFCRYGGVALVYLCIGLIWFGASFVGIGPYLISFFGGAVFVSGAFYFAIRIDSETATAASMGMIPVFALVIEFIASKLGIIEMSGYLNLSSVWTGAAVTVFGVALLQYDSSSSKIWGKSPEG